MKKHIAITALVLAAVPSVAIAQSDGLKVTGGGQVVAGGGNGGGPGDTIAFNAQQTSPTANSNGSFPAKGQLQVVQHAPGAGAEQVKFHGTVTCIRTFTSQSSGETYTRFGGTLRDGTPFTTDTQDNGEGASGGNDVILFRTRQSGEDPCDTSDESTQLRSPTLARGNVQEH